jgi:hypothetical protein
MREFLFILLDLAVTAAKLCAPGGVRAVIAENPVLKQQLIVLRRGRRWAVCSQKLHPVLESAGYGLELLVTCPSEASRGLAGRA